MQVEVRSDSAVFDCWRGLALGLSSLSGLTWTYLPLSIPCGAPLCPLSTRCLLPAKLSLPDGRPQSCSVLSPVHTPGHHQDPCMDSFYPSCAWGFPGLSLKPCGVSAQRQDLMGMGFRLRWRGLQHPLQFSSLSSSIYSKHSTV